MKQSESQLQRAILEYLNYNGVLAWRVNAGLVMVGDIRKQRLVKLAPTGQPDIAGVIKPSGRALFVEVKIKGNKPTPAQERRMQELADCGAKVILAYSLEDVIEGLKV